ncbi:diphthamide biosynthesis protein [Annulohypoxylon maeteangense]|uniref:diphthamide biosynthesis protein n=1 Tax=Annulohypoxylon maeteangense TaxID=1927788 RepID=UPI0020080A21|nr:diphthamide biosynthesis protein [Annulohypoxylon maeteangense]KAI0881367.1 diphthamide biosynthesis protein [Annulohypoxylon maeteangense]
MTSELSAPPVLSTPAEYIFEDPTPASAIAQGKRPHRPDYELYEVYEIVRTAIEIKQNGWNRIALQFPDAMLPDAPWVVNALGAELDKRQEDGQGQDQGQDQERQRKRRLYILADTSYSACCVDEIAAEHADADGVVHYGRACLSPTSRLPVLHIFTKQTLDYASVTTSFEAEFPEKIEKVVVMADVMFQEHVAPICELLRERGYSNVVATEIVRDPTGTIPNRKVVWFDAPAEEQANYNLNEYHLFHISTPPTSLLLTLSSRLASLRIYSTPSSPYTTTSEVPDPSATPGLLRRRYGLVIRLATASIIGILVNTLSVKNYMSTISTLKSQIAAAGKKSYTIVVGKLNAAKLANFAEVDGWVVVGCWESGLVEQEGLWKPVITPFELGLALQGDESRVWTGEWWGGIEGVEAAPVIDNNNNNSHPEGGAEQGKDNNITAEIEVEAAEGGVSDEESEAPEFDLRTGKLVSHSRPMRVAIRSVPRSGPETNGVDLLHGQSAASAAIVKRAVGDVALVNGVASPGAEFLRSQRTWQGLGTEFGAEDDGESTVVEEGRSGVARGYTVGQDQLRT